MCAEQAVIVLYDTNLFHLTVALKLLRILLHFDYGLATISRLLQIEGLFCKRAL